MSIFILILTFFVGLLVGRYTIFLIQKSLSIFISAVDKFLNKYFVFFLLAVLFFILFSLILTGGFILWGILFAGITELGKLIYLSGWVVGARFLDFIRRVIVLNEGQVVNIKNNLKRGYYVYIRFRYFFYNFTCHWIFYS